MCSTVKRCLNSQRQVHIGPSISIRDMRSSDLRIFSRGNWSKEVHAVKSNDCSVEFGPVWAVRWGVALCYINNLWPKCQAFGDCFQIADDCPILPAFLLVESKIKKRDEPYATHVIYSLGSVRLLLSSISMVKTRLKWYRNVNLQCKPYL